MLLMMLLIVLLLVLLIVLLLIVLLPLLLLLLVVALNPLYELSIGLGICVVCSNQSAAKTATYKSTAARKSTQLHEHHVCRCSHKRHRAPASAL